MVLAGDQDRDRAVASLREHFLRGRLTIDELSTRTEAVLRARSRSDLRGALAGVPQFTFHAVAQTAIRGGLLVVLTGAWLLFSFSLLVVLGLVALIHGASATELVAFLFVWLVPTYLLSRLWRSVFATARRGARTSFGSGST